ncbi:LptF/LptG family permease [Elizabethkingia argentiflava]|uniref:LptF/LptG family permease n=1 Tax=Elizabethkingia argenteiflava TaxID=2681556 RepID=A0A845PWR0_9FLAO|nr:LptF/LptG family permease [Elizabethkingia argenteiflava]NAW50758.1 LptF/LptG family permease [Elizabethkingia argenteiflava]
MIKKLDQYIIKTFFGPFLFIFCVLCFIFIVNLIWTQMGQIAGKGLSLLEISKLLFYMGITVIKMTLPLTILLASIMTFGEFGERYELAAMKSSGISLLRIMRPLFFTSILLSILLYFFSNNIIPDFQRKAKNMFHNITMLRPALNFTPGQFINTVPGMTIKFDKISGENGEKVSGVFIHKIANYYQDNQTVIAKNGKFMPAVDKNYLKLILYNGYIFQDENADLKARERQSDQSIKFDSLVHHFDISELLKKALEEQNITDDYQFKTYRQLSKTIEDRKKDNQETFKNLSHDLMIQQNAYIAYIDKMKVKKSLIKRPFALDSLKGNKKLEVLYSAYSNLKAVKTAYQEKEEQIIETLKYQAKIVMYQQRILSSSFTCVIFFMIGASLGSIIRKGGMGLPVIIAIVIFILFYLLNLTTENIAWKGDMNPYLATWLPNLILFPLGVWMTHKALTDSQLFDSEKYKAYLKPLINIFYRPKEHQRYQ